MKALKVFILAIAVLFVSGQFQVQAQTKKMKENTESWLHRAGGGGTPPDDGGLTGGTGATEDPDSILPISDGTYLLLALAGAYMVIRRRKTSLEK